METCRVQRKNPSSRQAKEVWFPTWIGFLESIGPRFDVLKAPCVRSWLCCNAYRFSMTRLVVQLFLTRLVIASVDRHCDQLSRRTCTRSTQENRFGLCFLSIEELDFVLNRHPSRTWISISFYGERMGITKWILDESTRTKGSNRTSSN